MNDLELIRDFRSHVEAADAKRTAAARAALVAEFDGGPRRRRGVWPRRVTRPAPVLASMLALSAIAATAVVAIVGPFGGSGVPAADAAILRHTDAALSPPPDQILHVKVAGDGFASEWWQLTSPPYSFVGDKGPAGAPTPEQAGNATTASYYDPRTNTIHQVPSAAPPAFEDPLAQVRQALDSGRARVLGSATTDGVPTYEIQFADTDGYSSQSLVAYVDQQTYRPLVLSDPQRDGTVVHLRVLTLRYLPATAANLQSLSLTARHPGARVVTDQSAKASSAGK